MSEVGELITLFRPAGAQEIALVAQSSYKRWPQRLPGQPFFYPVTNEQYAIEIARDWNVRESGYGCVTRFDVRASFMARYDVQTVGASRHAEWWIPAADLEEMNDNIVGTIEIIHEFKA